MRWAEKEREKMRGKKQQQKDERNRKVSFGLVCSKQTNNQTKTLTQNRKGDKGKEKCDLDAHQI